MPTVVLYQEVDGSVPLLDWLDRFSQNVRLACLARIELSQQTIVLSHGFVKQHAAVPPIEIDRARMRKADFSARPQEHTHKET